MRQGGVQGIDDVKEDRRRAAGETHRAELSRFWIPFRVWREMQSKKLMQTSKIWRTTISLEALKRNIITCVEVYCIYCSDNIFYNH